MEKTILLTISFALVSITAGYCQWTTTGSDIYYNSGKVGIGLGSPSYSLEVKGSGPVLGRFRQSASSGADAALDLRGSRSGCTSCDIAYLDLRNYDVNENAGEEYVMGRISGGMHDNSGNTGYLRFYTNAGNSLLERMRIDRNGNVGIGTTSPSGKLEVYGDLFTGTTKGIGSISDVTTFNNASGLFVGDAGFIVDNNNSGINLVSRANLRLFVNEMSGNAKEAIYVQTDGKVGIGTSTPQSELSVNGIITSTEVNVTATGWPDYVFSPTYHLRPLSEVQQFIQKNHRLPDMPSGREVEENGVNLGEMNSKLLEKIEELTLYMIELKKENEGLSHENTNLLQRLEKIEKEVFKTDK